MDWGQDNPMMHAHLTTQDHQNIAAAAQQYGVQPGLIAAILQDELSRLDIADYLQHMVAQGLCRLPHALASKLRHLAETLTRRSLDTHSFGPAQMKPRTLQEIAAADLLTIPVTPCQQVKLLLDRRQAPLLIAARVRQTINHWAREGVNLSHRPEILGTLYSLGLTGKNGVHANPKANTRGEAIARAAYAYRPPLRQSVQQGLSA